MAVKRHLKIAAAQEISARLARLGKKKSQVWTVHDHTILEWLEADVKPEEMTSRISELGIRQGGKPWDIPAQTIAAVLNRHYNEVQPKPPADHAAAAEEPKPTRKVSKKKKTTTKAPDA